MPPPRKVDLLPSEFKQYLQEELKKRGFAGYEELAEDLNWRLEEAGQTLRIGKSALHVYGQEYAEFVKYQEEASSWAASWMNDNGLKDEADRHNVLFQMVSTLAFKWTKDQIEKEGSEINPLDLERLGKMLSSLMNSAGMRERLKADERARVAKEAREAVQTDALKGLEDGVARGDIDAAAAQKAREVMGFA